MYQRLGGIFCKVFSDEVDVEEMLQKLEICCSSLIVESHVTPRFHVCCLGVMVDDPVAGGLVADFWS